jgi:hypothetical protein
MGQQITTLRKSRQIDGLEGKKLSIIIEISAVIEPLHFKQEVIQ